MVVVSSFGPGSSGKSTLINAVFGSNFTISEVKHSKGIHGTFFKLNDKQNSDYDGIFVIDTEGLAAEQKLEDRQKFDLKIFLFCLMSSDLIIINVKDRLDEKTK